MTIILGELEYNDCVDVYNKDSRRSKHFNYRNHRIALCSERANPLHYFEVYREVDNTFQIHCIYEDASLLVFNKDGLLITIMLLDLHQVQYYLNRIGINISESNKLRMSAKLNNKLPRNLKSLDDSRINDIAERKDRYMTMG